MTRGTTLFRSAQMLACADPQVRGNGRPVGDGSQATFNVATPGKTCSRLIFPLYWNAPFTLPGHGQLYGCLWYGVKCIWKK